MAKLNKSSQKNLFRWCLWFFLGNALLLELIGLRYVSILLPQNLVLNLKIIYFSGYLSYAFFTLTAYLGQFFLLALIAALYPLCLILILRGRARHFIFFNAIVLATSVAVLVVLDSVIYNLFRFHLSGIIAELFANNMQAEVLGISKAEYTYIFLVSMGLLSIETFYAYSLWNYLILKKRLLSWGRRFAISLAFCLYLSYALFVFSVDYPLNRYFSAVAQVLPLYENILAIFVPTKHSLIGFERRSERNFGQPQQAGAPLKYPHYQPAAAQSKPLMNLVIIVLETWRFDQLNSEVTPAIAKFAKRSWLFRQHFSGGNATGPGIFSLFYGIPATYWTAMQVQHRSPLLIEALLANHYQLGIFDSAVLDAPAFDKTVFQAVPNLELHTVGKNSYERDRQITQNFKKFIAEAAKNPQPFFSFLFYDATHNYCVLENTLKPFKPVVKECKRFEINAGTDLKPYLNRYKNALLLVDQQVAEVLKTLEDRHLLANTIVMITGDHGEEFDDNHRGYFGHASNFTPYQVQTPLVVYWPGKKPQVFTHQSSHFDVVPTLMKNLFSYATLPEIYTVGLQLTAKQPRPYLLISSYIDFGILEPSQITTIYPLGNYQIDRADGQALYDAKLNFEVLKKAFLDLRRFYV